MVSFVGDQALGNLGPNLSHRLVLGQVTVPDGRLELEENYTFEGPGFCTTSHDPPSLTLSSAEPKKVQYVIWLKIAREGLSESNKNFHDLHKVAKAWLGLNF